MRHTSIVTMAMIAIIALLFTTTFAAQQMNKEKFLEMIRQHRATGAPMGTKTIPTATPQPISPFSHLSIEEVQERMKMASTTATAQHEEIYAPGMEAQAAETTSTSTTTAEDDQHTKNLKKRAVIALAVFLPLLLLSFVAFFIYIFVFSKGSNRPEKKGGSQNSRKSANSGGGSHTTKNEKSERSQNESSVGGGGSRTRNQVSTTI